jgi:hypothetical protein
MIRFCQRLSTPVLVGLAVLASTPPKAHGLGRAMHLRPSFPMRPVAMNGTTRQRMTPFRTTPNRMTPNRMTPNRMTPNRMTPNRMTPFASQRDRRFDPFLRRDPRLDRFLGAGRSGFLGSAGTSFGVGDLGGGVLGGSGLIPYPVPYPAYANPYDTSNLYDLSGDAGGTNPQERSSAEEERQRSQREQLSRSLNNPPVNEIWSGQALNTVLADLAVKLGPETEGPGASISLDSGVLRHLNFTVSEGQGNPGLLKSEGRLPWPPALREKLYQANRDLLNDLAPVLYAQAMAGRVDPGTLRQMDQTAQQLQRQVAGNVRDMTPAQYGEARRFLVDLKDALKLLRRPDAGTYFAADAVQGTTAGKLVNHLVRNGWSFAPAVPGDEGAYVAVHRALVAYDLEVSKATTRDSARK